MITMKVPYTTTRYQYAKFTLEQWIVAYFLQCGHFCNYGAIDSVGRSCCCVCCAVNVTWCPMCRFTLPRD